VLLWTLSSFFINFYDAALEKQRIETGLTIFAKYFSCPMKSLQHEAILGLSYITRNRYHITKLHKTKIFPKFIDHIVIAVEKDSMQNKSLLILLSIISNIAMSNSHNATAMTFHRVPSALKALLDHENSTVIIKTLRAFSSFAFKSEVSVMNMFEEGIFEKILLLFHSSEHAIHLAASYVIMSSILNTDYEKIQPLITPDFIRHLTKLFDKSGNEFLMSLLCSAFYKMFQNCEGEELNLFRECGGELKSTYITRVATFHLCYVKGMLKAKRLISVCHV
jgi:phosphopantetheine adenylyltransferase